MKAFINEIGQHVQKFYGDAAGVDVQPDTTLDELGLDSLDRTELVIHVEREFNITIPDEKWDECTTVGLLAQAAHAAKYGVEV